MEFFSFYCIIILNLINLDISLNNLFFDIFWSSKNLKRMWKHNDAHRENKIKWNIYNFAKSNDQGSWK